MSYDLVQIVLGAAVAGLVQGLSGFAFGLTAMAFWAWSVDPQLAGPMVVFGSLIGQILSIGSARHGFRLALVAPFVAGGAVGVPVGVALLRYIDPTIFKALVGVLLAIYCPVMLFVPQHVRVSPRTPRLADGLIGVVGGIMGGLGGLTGPAVTLWATLRAWDKNTQRAVFQTFNLAMHTFTLGAYVVGGLIGAKALAMFALITPAMLIPTLIGARLYARFAETSFRRLVLTLLAMSGLTLLAAALPVLWHH